MKNSVLSLFFISCIAFSLLTSACLLTDNQKREKVFLVNIGDECIPMNMSTSYLKVMTKTCGVTGSIIPVRHGDLLYIDFLDTGEFPFIFQYDEKDGNKLIINRNSDNDSEYLFSVNNSVIQLNLSNVPGVWEWLENASPEELKHIRTLFFPGEIDPSYFNLLQKIEKVNKHPGIAGNPGQLLKLLPMFQPDWLFIGDFGSFDEEGQGDELYDLLKKQKNVKTLFFQFYEEDPVQGYKFLSSFPALKNIMLTPSFINQATSLPGNLKSLEELLISGESDEEINDISIIKDLEKIKKVRFVGTEIYGDIDYLYSIPGLTALSFTATNVENIPEAKNIPRLKWFSFPVNTDQEYFKVFLEKNPQLEYLEILGCEDIGDLSPLMNLKNPKGIILFGMEIEDYSPLYNLKSLEFLILMSECEEAGEYSEIEELKKNLPDSDIVLWEPYCLGSGWILLFPLIVLVCIVVIICLKRYRIHTAKRI